MRSKRIYICYYNFSNNKSQWLLTNDMNYAKSIDQRFQLASVEDLHDWVAATGQTYNGILSVREGLCKWVEDNYINDFGEIEDDSGYVLI